MMGRGTRWYQETNLCLRSKASSTMGPYTSLSIFPPWRRDSQVIQARRAPLGPCREHGAKHIPARQIIFNHNRTFVLALQPPHLLQHNTLDPPPSPVPMPITSHELDLTSRWPHTWPPESCRQPSFVPVSSWDGNLTIMGHLTSLPVSDQSVSQSVSVCLDTRELAWAG